MAGSQATLDDLFRAPPPRPGGRTAVDAPSSRTPNIDRILSLTVTVSVTLAERDMPLESILAINLGTILEFDVASDTELTLNVANHPIGKGRAVKTGENFGLRITQIGSVTDRIGAMGGQ